MVALDQTEVDTGLAHHIAMLEHCENVLRCRVREDASNSWQWRAKLKAVLFALRTLEGRLSSADSVPDIVLEEDGIHEVSLWHPLLQTGRIVSTSRESREQTEWYQMLMDRVKQFAYRNAWL
jgi:hypothetical protein